MWSRRFLWVGISSGVAVAAIALSGIWFLLFMIVGAPRVLEWIVLPGIVGVVVYPACWYLLVFRHRDYGIARTFLVILLTYLVSCGLVALGMVGYAIYDVVAGPFDPIPRSARSSGFWGTQPFFAVMFTILGAMILVIPFLLIAAPMAYLHRIVLLTFFKSVAQ